MVLHLDGVGRTRGADEGSLRINVLSLFMSEFSLHKRGNPLIPFPFLFGSLVLPVSRSMWLLLRKLSGGPGLVQGRRRSGVTGVDVSPLLTLLRSPETLRHQDAQSRDPTTTGSGTSTKATVVVTISFLVFTGQVGPPVEVAIELRDPVVENAE